MKKLLLLFILFCCSVYAHAIGMSRDFHKLYDHQRYDVYFMTNPVNEICVDVILDEENRWHVRSYWCNYFNNFMGILRDHQYQVIDFRHEQYDPSLYKSYECSFISGTFVEKLSKDKSIKGIMKF